MGKTGKILLGAGAAVAVGAALTYATQQWRETSVMDDAREAQVASDKEITSGVATKLLWGDTHLHTSNSIDAFGFGVKLGPEDALRFARGEEVTSTWGIKAKLALRCTPFPDPRRDAAALARHDARGARRQAESNR
jgi:hypothetical protein